MSAILIIFVHISRQLDEGPREFGIGAIEIDTGARRMVPGRAAHD